MKKAPQDDIEKEILREKAQALGGTGKALEKAMSQLAAVENDIKILMKSGQDGQLKRAAQIENGTFQELVAEYKRRRRLAFESRRKLIIQREAIGFRNHSYVFEKYPLPESIKDIIPLDKPISVKGGNNEG